MIYYCIILIILLIFLIIYFSLKSNLNKNCLNCKHLHKCWSYVDKYAKNHICENYEREI